MTFVNLFSKYIKKIADETGTDYADVLKSFEKSKRLQADWKAYRDAEVKTKPFLFKPPVIERVIRFENIEPISSVAIPTPTNDTTIQVDKDSENSVIITELDDGGVEETKEEDAGRLFQLVQDLEINPISSRPSQPPKLPSKSDKPISRAREKIIELNELERALYGIDEEDDYNFDENEYMIELLKRQAGDIAESTLDKTINKLKTIKEEKGKKREQAISFVNKTIEQAKGRAIKQLREEEKKREEEMNKLFGFDVKQRVKQLEEEREKKRQEEEKDEEDEFTISPKKTITIKVKKPKTKKSPKVKKEIEGEGVEDYLPVRRNYPPKSRQVLFYNGNEKIRDMKIVRTELSPVVFNTVNFLTEYTTKGRFQQRFKQMPYDKLYHLALIVTTQEGSIIKIEKNEVLNVELNPTISSNAEVKQITTNVPRDLTIATMLYKAQSRMGGDRFFTYNAVRNNCQDFLLNILDANKIGDESDRQFIKQDVAGLFKGFEGTENFLSLLTSIASIANRLIYGNGIKGEAVADKDYVVQTIIFNKSKWDADKANKWLRENKYKNKGIDEKENSLRYRQVNPDYIKKKGFDKYATKALGKSGISIVLAYKKNK